MSEKEKRIFNCETCGNELEMQTNPKEVPECCGKPMKAKPTEPLPFCEVSTTAEHARLDDDFGEACDDGRAGKV